MDVRASSPLGVCLTLASSLPVEFPEQECPCLRDCVSSCVQVWRIENLELVPVEYQWHGFFYGSDCYLVLYTYDVNGKPHYILYIWQVGQAQALLRYWGQVADSWRGTGARRKLSVLYWIQGPPWTLGSVLSHRRRAATPPGMS